jgi:membrane protease YdiL (CAAX protease family)
MQQNLVSNKNPFRSVILIFIVVFIGFVFVGPLIGLTIASGFYDGNLLVDLQSKKADPTLFLPLMITQGITSLLGLIVMPLLYLKFIEHKPFAPFFKTESDLIKSLVLIVGIGLSFLIAISPVAEWNMKFVFPEFLEEFGKWARAQEDTLAEMTKLLTHFNTPADYAIGMLVIAILPGIGEEIVFRGFIQNELFRSNRNIHLAIWTSAILFSAIHMQFFGFVPRVLLGALFGYLYYWSGNLAIPMIAHFFHNGFTLTMLYLYQLGSIDINIDSEESAPWSLVALGMVFTFTLLYFFRKHYSTQQLQ